MGRIVTFGEIMMRLATSGFERLAQAARLQITYAGAEANVAVAAACFGHDAAFVTTLPTGPIGDAAVASLRRYGVDVSAIRRSSDGRMGLYFLETGASQRASRVIYDRQGSSMALAAADAYPWPVLLEGARAFHTTGITPALSPQCAASARDALRQARRIGAMTSLDLNYRAKLWPREAARRTLEPLLSDVDLLVANEEDAEAVLGLRAARAFLGQGTLDRDAYQKVAESVHEKYGIPRIAITLRESESATINHWSACLWDAGSFYLSRRYTIHVVDRVGAGDAFAGALIAATLDAMSPRDALEFAVAASCLKHTIVGDFNLVTRDEVEMLCAGEASGRVVR